MPTRTAGDDLLFLCDWSAKSADEKWQICEFSSKLVAAEAAKQVELKDYKIVRIEDWL